MKSKKSIISCLCFISLLSACNNSSSIVDTSSYNDETNKALLQEMLNKASEGVSLESLVTIKSKVNYNSQDDEAVSYFYLDTQTTPTEYSYQQYEDNENKNKLTKDVVTSSGNLSKNLLGYAQYKFLGIDNKIYYATATQENIKGDTEYLKWDESGLANFFTYLNSSMFKIEGNKFTLKTSEIDENILKNITSCIYGENTIPFVDTFILESENNNLTKYYIQTKSQKRVDSSTSVSYELSYTFEGNITGIGDDENVTKHFINPKNGEEDKQFKEMMNRLSQGNYTENVKMYQVADINYSGTLLSNNTYTYANHTLKEEILDNKNNLVSFDGYYITDNNELQKVVPVSDKGYYNQGLVYTYNGSSPFADFNISSLFFEKNENTFTYNYSTSDAKIFYSGALTFSTSLSIYQSTITLNDNDTVEITSYCPQVYNNTYYFIKIVSTYSNIGSSVTNIDKEKITNGDNLTWEDYFANDEYLSIAKNILTEDLFNSISPIGGVYNDVTLYANESDNQVQMQFKICSLLDFDNNRDNTLDEEEQLYLYLYVYSILKEYDKKIDMTNWENKNYNYIAEPVYQEITLTKNYKEKETNKRLTFDIYFSYDQTTSNAYIVFDITNKSLYTITFDLNYEGSTNIVQTLTEGTSITTPFGLYRNGYAFGGWFLDKECTKPANPSKEKATKDITYYAKWILE